MNFKIISFVASIVLNNYALASSVEQESDHSSMKSSQVQNFSRALKYFQCELDFTTNPARVKAVVEKRVTNVTIVDVRANKDYQISRIPGAVNIPFNKHNSFEGNEKEFPALRKDGFNYVYCYEHLCNLSQKACKKFASLGYPVKEVKGGFQGWKEHNYVIDDSKL